MQFELKMPDLATTDSEIRIGQWMVEPGQEVKRGQPIVEVETDKAAMEVECVVNGKLLEIRAQVDDEVSVGDIIAVLEVADAPNRTKPVAAPQPAAEAPATPLALPSAPAADKPRGGMFARNKAKTGAGGQPADDIPLSVAQRTAAKRLQESKQTIPHYYLQRSINAAPMMARREASKEARLAWDAFFVHAVARAMRQYNRFACRFEGDHLARMKELAVGVAIDHDGELYVIPVVDPGNKTVETISAEIRRNVERLKSGDPEARMIRPAAMTVSNLGVCNVESFTPIINPPETAILGVGRTAPTLVAREDGSFAVEQRCMLTLSIDHRVASGRYAAEFLNAIVQELEAIQ